MALGPHFLNALPFSDGACPAGGWAGIEWLFVLGKVDAIERLKKADEHVGRLVVRELLAKTDTRTGVKGQEDEWVRCQVLVKTGIQETIWVELFG